MMFWLMLPSNIFVLLILHFTSKGAGKPNGNIILGVKIPTIYLKDERVQTIVKEYEVKYKSIFWVLLLVQVVGYPIRQWVSVSLLWIYADIALMVGGYTYYIEYYARKLRALKKAEGWTQGDGHILNIDMEVSRLKNTFPVSRSWFLIPLAIILLLSLGEIQTLNNTIKLGMMAIVLVEYAAGIILYEIFIRVATMTYSNNTDINIALNKAYKSAWSKYCVFVSYISLLFLPLVYVVDGKNEYSTIFTIYLITIVVLSTMLSIIPMMMIHRNLKKLNTKLLGAEVEEYYIDDDEYWTAFAYNNPYDKKTWVSKRIGIGMTMNMATIGGKIFAYITAIIIVGTIVWSMWITIPIDFDTIAIEETTESYEVGVWGDTYEFLKEDIVSVELLEELPRAYRNVGSSTERMRTGTFSVKGYGQSVVYAMNDVPLYIVVELEDGSYVFLNGEDVETTREYYEGMKI